MNGPQVFRTIADLVEHGHVRTDLGARVDVAVCADRVIVHLFHVTDFELEVLLHNVDVGPAGTPAASDDTRWVTYGYGNLEIVRFLELEDAEPALDHPPAPVVERLAHELRSGYALRHTFAMRLVDAGVHPRRVAELMGHSDLRTIMDYTGQEYDELRAAVELLP